MGVKTIPIPRTKIDAIDIPKINIDKSEIIRTDYETINLTVLRRGVIGVNQIGYIVRQGPLVFVGRTKSVMYAKIKDYQKNFMK